VNLEMLNAVAALVTIVGLPLVLLSLFWSQKALALQATQAIYDKAIDVDMFFLEHLSLKNRVYGESAANASLDCDEASIKAACELMTDLFQQVVTCKKALPKDAWLGWERFMLAIMKKSPAMRNFVDAYGKQWYSPELLKVLQEKPVTDARSDQPT
jgi:hypothetical protein